MDTACCTDAPLAASRRDRADAAGPRPRGLSVSAMKRVADYVERHIDQNISLERLAAVACMSRFHFARLFRRSTGLSPMEYVKRERIELAKRLLVRGEARISIVAVEVGFFDQSHFTRVFRKLTGVPPGHYSRDTRSTPDATVHGAPLRQVSLRQVAPAREERHP